jgi:CRP-like cAMP-binding protein
MPANVGMLRGEVDKALKEGRPADAVCYLAELVAATPEDRHTRTALAIALGDAGHPAGALKVLRALADRLAHQGYLLPAMIVVRHGLERAGEDAGLLSTLKRLHVRGVRAKAGDLPMPPPLKSAPKDAPSDAAAASLLMAGKTERLEKITQIACDLGPAGAAAIPLPMPLFSELDEEAFLETVKRLHYKRVGNGAKLLVEGEKGDSLLVVASGHVTIKKGEADIATLGPGSVLGEMALITGAPRSATAVSKGEVEVFELTRQDVEQLAKQKPKIAEELVEYCRKRLIGNLLRTSPLFKRFDDTTRYLLIDKFKRMPFQPGQKIIEQGKAGTGLYVLATGEVQVNVSKDGGDVTVANLGPGDVFGEIALLNDSPTTATVSARDRVGALFLPRDEFQQVLSQHPDVRKYLEGLSSDRLKASQAAVATEEVLEADDLIVL